MHTWHWHNWQELPYLTCSLLKDWHHGFFTQQFWPRSPEDLTTVLQPKASAYRLKQVHGNIVLTPQDIERRTGEDDSGLVLGDGVISQQPLQAVWVASADCTPILIGDVKTGQVAALHAGWRGTSAKILPVAITRLQEKGSKLGDLRIAMGPAIAGEVYQVSLDVAAQIGASIIPYAQPQQIIEALHELPHSPLLVDPEPGKVRLDVRRVNVLQLESLGMSAEQIAIAPYCTYQTPEYFFSYRRERQKKIQWSGIVSAINPDIL
jgi:polyphenol oxidase